MERHPKGELPVDRVFAKGSEPLLRLVTCGGEFDGQRKSYRDNVVVYARESVTTSRSYPSSLALALR